MPKVLLSPYRNTSTISGLVLKHDNWLDQSVKQSANVEFNSLTVGNLRANGEIFLSGTVTLIETDTLTVKDAFIELNKDNINPLSLGGIRVNRGNSLAPFDIIYNETDQTLRIGNETNLQPVATREENPIDNYVAVWDSTNHRFKTTNNLSNISIDNITISSISIGGSTLSSTGGGDLSIDSPGNVLFGGNVILADTKQIILSSNIFLQQMNGELYVSSNLQMNPNQQINWGSNGGIYSSNSGANVGIQGDTIFLNPVTETLHNSSRINHGGIGLLEITTGNNYTISSTGSLKLMAVDRVLLNNLSIGTNTNFQVDVNTDSNGNLTIDSPGNITLSPTSDVFINTSKRLSFGTSSKNIMVTNGGDLVFSSDTGIVLNSTFQVYIPTILNIQTNTSISEQIDGTTVFSASNSDIILSPGTTKAVKIPENRPLIFGSDMEMFSNESTFTLDSMGTLLLNVANVNIPQGVPLQFGGGGVVYTSISNDLQLTSNKSIVINAVEDIKLSAKVYVNNCLINQDTFGSLVLSSGSGQVKTDTFLVTGSTTGNVNGSGALKVSGGVYIGDNLIVSNDTTVGILNVGTSVIIQDSSVPLKIQNSSAVSGLAMELKGVWDTNSGYTIGRGTNTLGGGRSMSFTVAPFSNYGIGSKPSFRFGSTGIEFMSLSEDGTIITSLNVTNNGIFGGYLRASIISNTSGSFQVTDSGMMASAGATVMNGFTVLDSNSVVISSITSQGFSLNKSFTTTSTITSLGKINCMAGADFSGNLNMGGNRLYNVVYPSMNSDAATKEYVDNVVSGRDNNKAAVVAASIGNIDINSSLFSLDSETLSVGDRILLKNQSDGIQNGIYVINSSNVPIRASDMMTGVQVGGSTVFVMGGSVNVSVGFLVIGTNVIVDTNVMEWTPFSGALTINTGTALDKSGNTLSVKVDNSSITTNLSNELAISTSFFGQGFSFSGSQLEVSSDLSHVTKLGEIISGKWEGSPINVEYGGTGLSQVSQGNILYGNENGTLSESSDLCFLTNSLGINTGGIPLEYLHVKNVPNTFTGSFILIQDVDSISSGLKIKTSTRSGSLVLDSNGVLVLGQDDTDNSRVSISTQQLKRMTIDSNGSVMIGTETPDPDSILTVNGQLMATNISSNGNLSIPQATLSGDNATTNNTGLLITASSVRLTSQNLITESDAMIGNIALISSSSNVENILMSRDKTTTLPIPLKIRVSNSDSGLSGVAYNGGFLIPGTLQIGGNETDSTTGFKLTLISDNLQVTPGQTGKKVVFNGPTVHSLLSIGDIFELGLDSGNLILVNTGNTSNYTIGGISSNTVIFSVENQNGDGIVYDPTNNIASGGLFQVSSNVTSEFGQLVLNNETRYTSGNTIEGVYTTQGWYYLGTLGVGTTCIISYFSWEINLYYDGILPYSVRYSSISSRNTSNLVVFKSTTGDYHLFVQVLVAPNHINITESPNKLFFNVYEGSSSVPTGSESGYDSQWVKDFDLSMSTPVGLLSVGSLNVESNVTLSNTNLSGSTNIIGTLDCNGNCVFTGTDYIWNSSISSTPMAELISTVNSNSFALHDTTLQFSKETTTAEIGLQSDTLVLNHQSNTTLSNILFKTRNTDRLRIDDTGMINIISTQDQALLVAGGALFEKKVIINDQLKVNELILSGPLSQVDISILNDTFPILSFNGARITNVSDPINDTDVVNKKYVESLIQGLRIKDAVRAASTGNIDITVAISALDNVVVEAGDRILLKDQTNAVENGIYIVVQSSNPIRSDDLKVGDNGNGVYVYVTQGVQNGTSGWVCTDVNQVNDIVGTSALTFVQFSGAGQITAGLGLRKTGNVLYVNADDQSIEVNSGQVRIKNTAAGVGLSGGSGVPLYVSDITHLSNLGTITSGVWNGSPIPIQYGGTGASSISSGKIVYSKGSYLSEGLLYFDDSNVRVGINTTSPTSGLTVKDRDIQIHQFSSTPLYMLLSSQYNNYSFAIRNDTSRLVFSGGTGVNKNTLSDMASFSSSGILDVTAGITTGYIKLNLVKYSNTAVSKTSLGKLQIDYYSIDNSGSILRFFGRIGTESNIVNAEWMQLGFDGTRNVLNTQSSGTGHPTPLELSVGSHTDQLTLETDGNVVMSGILSIQSTTDSVNSTTGSIVTAGGIGANGTITSRKLHVYDTTDTAAIIDGYLTVSRDIVMRGNSQDYTMTSTNTGEFSIQSLGVGTPNIVKLVSTGNTDCKMQIFGKGNVAMFGSEWLEMGYNVTQDIYQVKVSDKNLVITTSPNYNQILLYPDNNVVISGTTSVNTLNVLDSTDATSFLNGGAMTIHGGLGVTKTLYVGNFIESGILRLRNRIEYSNNSSIDKVYTSYTSNGNFNFYNNQTLGLNVHYGGSGGPVSTNQEKLYIGYTNSTSVSISSTSSGTGVTRNLSIDTRFFPNQILLNALDGSTSFLKNIIIQDTSLSALQVSGGCTINRALNVSGKVKIGNGNGGIQGDLLELDGLLTSWKFASDISLPGVLVLECVNTDTSINIRDKSGTSVFYLDANAKNTVTSATSIFKSTSTTAVVIKNDAGDDKFVFDTVDNLLDCNASRIINLALPLSPGDAVNKSYVDNLVTGLKVREAVNVSSTGNINILNAVTSLDGTTVNVNDRVLIQNQTNKVENGIYKVQSGNFITRSSDFTNGTNASGVYIYVKSGVVNGEKGFVCTSESPNDIIGTNDITFTQFIGQSMIQTGKGLIYNGNVVDVNLASYSSLTFTSGGELKINPTIAGNGLTLSDTGVLNINAISELSTVTIGVWEATPVQLLYGGTGNTIFSDKSVVFSDGSRLNGANGLVWDDSKIALGINGIADPNTSGDGISLVERDIFIQGETPSLLFGDALGNYNWRFRRAMGDELLSVPPVSSHRNITISKSGNLGIVTGDPGSPFYLTKTSGATWTDIVSLENFAWGETSMSQDGMYIIIVAQQDYIYVSQNYGVTFTAKVTDFTRFWEWTSISDNGQYMMASSLADGVFVSLDYGNTFTEIINIPTDITDIGFVHVTKIGSSQFAGYFGGVLFMSTDSGNTFSSVSIRSGNYYDIEEATLSDYLVLYEYPGSLWISSDLGLTWQENVQYTNQNWVSVTMSSNGQRICAVAENSLLYISTDYGTTFSPAIDSTPREWRFTKMTLDGLTIFAGGVDIPVFISKDGGSTWNIELSPRTVYSASLSLVSDRIYFAEYNGNIFSFTNNPHTNFIISSGKETVKSSLSSSFIFTENGLFGIGYNEINAANISATLDVNGNVLVSDSLTCGVPLQVSSGGSGTNTLNYGLVVSNGNQPYQSTGGLAKGELLIGKDDNSGEIVKEYGDTLRSSLGLSIGVDIQGHYSTLDNLGTLSAGQGYFIVGNGSQFTTQSSGTVLTTLGLKTLALRDNVNNNYWLGSELAVANGGTGSVTFSSNCFPFFNGNVLTSSIITQNTLTTIQIGGDIESTGSFSFVDLNSSWKLRKQDDNLIFSGGTTTLQDTLQLNSSGQVVIYSTTDSISSMTGAMTIAGGLGMGGSLHVANTGYFDSTMDSVDSLSGSLVVSGGLGVKKSMFIDGVMNIESTIDCTSTTNGALVVKGGLGLSKKMYTSGNVIIEKNSVVGVRANGLTVGADIGIWVENSVLTDSSRHVSLINNVTDGSVVLSMRNITADYGWDQIVGGSLLAFQTNGLATKTWMTLDAVTGSLTLKSTGDSTDTNAASLVVYGGIYGMKSIHTLSTITATDQLNVETTMDTCVLGLTNNTGTSSITFDLDTLVLQNNTGQLQLRGNSVYGITVSSNTGNVIVESTDDLAMSIHGGISVEKKAVVKGDLQVDGILNVASLTSEPTLTTQVQDMVNISVLQVNSVKLMTVNDLNTLHATFKVTPSVTSSTTIFTFSLPNKMTVLADTLDIYSAQAAGYEDDINLNKLDTLCTGVANSLKGIVKFTSVSTNVHYIQVSISYSTL